ncbi:MAG: TIGR01777 family protein [Desulfobulbus sp.]|nr:TIGR01777 family protein [Desulfobulbus sp.]
MKILLTGGSGFVGTALSRKLIDLGHEITIIGSSGHCLLAPHPQLTYVTADTTRPGDWQEHVPGQDGLINLTGRSVISLWTKRRKKAIYDSRILTTRNLVTALPDSSKTILLSTSAAGYYGDGGEEEKPETSPAGGGFLARVCEDWEAEAYKAADKGARVAVMRFGLVLGKGGGALATMKLPFQLGLGGPIGNGRQWFPWIHLEDLVNAAIFLLGAEQSHGAFNFTAPHTVRQKEFARELGRVLKRPAFLPTPAFIVKLVLGEFGRSLLQGQKTVPDALINSGFQFTYPDLHTALLEATSD